MKSILNPLTRVVDTLQNIEHRAEAAIGIYKSLHFEDLKPSEFPWRTGCGVTLYQDAHVGCDAPPMFFNWNEGEIWSGPQNCWDEMYQAILNAKHIVYLTGWSVQTSITMLRRTSFYPIDPTLPPPPSAQMTIGELLKYKASHGVRVILHLWNEATSITVDQLHTSGIMHTHDEETRAYFRGTAVVVDLSYRHRGDGIDERFKWSHHQKTVIVDAAGLVGAPPGRRLMAFVGGLDLTGGRWDTPAHSLFRTLGTDHASDYYQGWGDQISSAHGPRQPWHDVHSRLEGQIAWDVLSNFEERWRKQGVANESLWSNGDQHLIPQLYDNVTQAGGATEWHCRLVRSIDWYSAKIPSSSGSKKIKEQGIQRAYIEMIRAARRFIYIENQYFMGGSDHWRGDRSTDCRQLIPFEIAERIVKGIRDGAPVRAYIVIPLYPEGFPEDGAIQEMLHWQWKTMQMMYRIIAEAIQHAGLSGTSVPTDYLNFYCLGNRETMAGATPQVSTCPTNPVNARLFQSRRFYVYVHAKMMIVDDDHVILGSANINERSMSGDRDTEIAVQCFQPAHLYQPNPRGHIHHFRLSLWAEHTRVTPPIFLTPHKLECVRELNLIADANLAYFLGSEVVELPSHLMRYPISVDSAGHVTAFPTVFPDTNAPVHGASELFIPSEITA